MLSQHVIRRDSGFRAFAIHGFIRWDRRQAVTLQQAMKGRIRFRRIEQIRRELHVERLPCQGDARTRQYKLHAMQVVANLRSIGIFEPSS
ncbi:hypothetical protein D3C71_2053460 [compost metagenome]